MIQIVKQNICLSSCKYLAHQVNQITSHAAGVAKEIFIKYPYSNNYKLRILRNYISDPNKLGTIDIFGDGLLNRFIINMNAQFYPGPGSNKKIEDKEIDTDSYREQYFKSCLDEISKIKDINSIAFPFLIGCGMANGNWDNYYKMLEDFSNKIYSEQNADVYLYKL